MDINFGGKPPEQNKVPGRGPADNVILEEFGQLQRRVKLLENALNNLRNSVQTIEKNMIDSNKEDKVSIKSLEEENMELKEELRVIKLTLKKVVDDLGNTARADEVKVIQKYLDLWSPVKFITPDMARKIAADVYADMRREAKVSAEISDLQKQRNVIANNSGKDLNSRIN